MPRFLRSLLDASARHPWLEAPVRRYREWRRRRQPLVNPRPFLLVNIELTNKCPMRCVMCPRTNNMTREQGLMDFDLFKKVIDEYVEANPEGAASQNTWLHHFGESLVHPEFGKFMRYAVDKGVNAGMSVNPIMLKPAVSRELLDSRPAMVLVALDGHDDASFAAIRGLDNAYERSKENLLEFLRLKVASGSRTRVAVSMIDFSLNKASIASTARFWKGVPGVDEVLPKPFITWNGDAKDVNRFLEQGKADNLALRAKATVPLCSKPWWEMSVTWDGDVVPCCYDYDKKYALGNVRTARLPEIWNGERMRALRREFLENRVENPLCRECEYLYKD